MASISGTQPPDTGVSDHDHSGERIIPEALQAPFATESDAPTDLQTGSVVATEDGLYFEDGQ